MPDWIISSAASRVPVRTNAGDTVFASAGKMYCCSQSISARSSARPRYSTIGAWVCVLMSPGSTMRPVASTVARPVKRRAMSAAGPTATMRAPSMATAPRGITVCAASIVTTVPPVTTRETARADCVETAAPAATSASARDANQRSRIPAL